MVILAGDYWDESMPLDPELRPADCDSCGAGIAVMAGILVLDGPMMMLCPACYAARPGLGRIIRAAPVLGAVLAGVVLALVAAYAVHVALALALPRP